MQKRIVINNGKTYHVNVAGWEDGIGAGSPTGIAWMQDQTGSWYTVQLTGLSGSLSYSISLIPTNSKSVGMYANDFGYQIVQASNGSNYQVYITSSGPTLVVSQSIAPYNSAKPYLFLQSNTDGAYYYVGATLSASVVQLRINDNSRINGRLVSY
jgi:hypothetical protein